jgi:hypothetical protein
MSFPLMIPNTPAHAPERVTFPDEISIQLEQLQRGSGAIGNEWGCAIVLNATSGKFELTNFNRHGSSNIALDHEVIQVEGGATLRFLGTFHTHPYAEPWKVGAFDGTDTKNFFRFNEIFKIVQSQSRQFMYLRTAKSHQHLDLKSMDDTRIALEGSKIFGESVHPFNTSSWAQAWAMAKMCDLALYAGQHGILHRAYPAAHHSPRHRH